MNAAGKADLRRALRARRDAFVADLGERRAAGEDALAAAIVSHLRAPMLVAGYVAIGAEAGVAPILLAARRLGLATALPHVTARDAPMRFLRWRPGDPLEGGPFGSLQPADTSEPATPDLILAPLVGFDRGGGRLGQGAGCYDRVFAAVPGAWRIGIAWSVQEIPVLPLDAWDMPLHAIATEREWIETPPRPSWRKPFGIFVILALIAALGAVVAHFATRIATLPGWLQLPLYAVLGLVWIAPLKPLLRWMEAGGGERGS